MEQEVVEKVKDDEQWNEYHKRAEKSKEGKKPSGKQIAYIVSLAASAGLRVKLESIKTSAQAASLIRKLRLLNRQMNSGSLPDELRQKRVAFGMAAKLVFQKYAGMEKDYKNSEEFWKEVEEFFREYQEAQERAVGSLSF